MEAKLLNFNRFMANFSTKIVGGFIPVIVYNYATTNKMQLALLTLIIQSFVNFILNLIFKNLLVKKPQLFLFLRIIPIIIYEVLLLYITHNPIWCVVGIGLAYSVGYTFKNIPNEVLFAFVNARRKTGTGKQLALTKMIDQTGIILALILGGLGLDYLDMEILIIISISLYFVGSLPLLIYYIVHRKDKTINQEYSTYEHIALKEKSTNTRYANSVSKKIRVIYCIFYLLQECMYALYSLLPLLLFVLTGKFTYSAIASAIFEVTFALGCYFVGKLESKRDLTNLSATCGVLVGVIGISFIFLNEATIWLLFILIAIFGFCYAVAYFFVYHRMLMKSKIVGRNTTCIINRINMNLLSICFVVAFGLFAPISVCFCVGGAVTMVSGFITPKVEEKTRQLLVDHLEDNEIREDSSVFSRKKKM